LSYLSKALTGFKNNLLPSIVEKLTFSEYKFILNISAIVPVLLFPLPFVVLSYSILFLEEWLLFPEFEP